MQTSPDHRSSFPVDTQSLIAAGADVAFDSIVAHAADICSVPKAAIGIVNETHLWFKAKIGMNHTVLPRYELFCKATLNSPDGLVIDDIGADQRFSALPSVLGQFDIRFYAGLPLRAAGKFPVGTLSIMDVAPRHLSRQQLRALELVAQLAEQLIDHHFAQEGIVVLKQQCRRMQDRLNRIEALESQRLANELHDGLSQELVAVELALASLTRSAGGIASSAHARAIAAGDDLTMALKHCRDFTKMEAALAVEAVDLFAFLRHYCSYLQDVAHASTSLRLPTALRVSLPPNVSHHLSRIAQEAIANARKHSGASSIIVEVIELPQRLLVVIEDNGNGLSKQALQYPGVGMSCMRYRAEAIDARLEFAATPGGGTRVSCALDLSPLASVD
jgi:two-component system, sensor histidine kinase